VREAKAWPVEPKEGVAILGEDVSEATSANGSRDPAVKVYWENANKLVKAVPASVAQGSQAMIKQVNKIATCSPPRDGVRVKADKAGLLDKQEFQQRNDKVPAIPF
jgi:hypothetical protein